MICYMPFSYIEDQFISKLTHALGPVSVSCPNPGMIPEHMLAWAEKEMLDLRPPQGVDVDQLSRAVHEFKAWADLHQGNIADIAAFFKSGKGRPPLVDETNPTSIGDQIRHFGQNEERKPADPLFQAALFLCMAQEYDMHLDTVTRDLGVVKAMEQDMLARLAEDGIVTNEGLGPDPTARSSAGASDSGSFMTARRVRAWAELACRDDQRKACNLFLTASPAVLDHILDQFPPALGPWCLKLDIEANGYGDSNPKFLEAIEKIAYAEAAGIQPPDYFLEKQTGIETADMVIYVMAGISPRLFPFRILGPGSKADQPAPHGKYPANTLFGLINK